MGRFGVGRFDSWAVLVVSRFSYMGQFVTPTRRYCDRSCLLIVCLLVLEFVCVFINMFFGFWGRMSGNRLEIEARFQWSTTRKWYTANRMVT